MSDLTERPADGQDADEHNELGYRNVDEERAYDEAGEQGPPGDDPAAQDDDHP